MILVISYIECNHFLLFPFIGIFHKREYQATIGRIILSRYILHSPVNKGLFLYPTSCGHRELYFLSHGIVLRIIGTRLSENTEHIEDATAVTIFRFHYLAILVCTLLVDVTYTVPISEPSLIDSIAFALFGSFTKVTGFKLVRHNAYAI